jgi:NurA-like 5'-3' nuclease
MQNTQKKYPRLSASISQDLIDDLKFEAIKKRTTVSGLLEEILRERKSKLKNNDN